jgi:ribosomal protein L16 Arg81 hydroxylase
MDMEKTQLPSTLPQILAPYAVEQFLKEDWLRSVKHLPGWKGKFTGLLSWSRLNEILGQHRLEPPRLRLAIDGKIIPSDTYVRYSVSRRRNSSRVPHLLSTAITERLYQGATLVLDAVDELHEPLTRLAESLEQLFRVRIQMNLYAGWKTSKGFDLHWDDHEVLIIQLRGRKRWEVHRPTRSHPLAEDLVENPPPEGPAVWEGILEDGDLLYIPRGWWHLAIPLDEPTMHITIGIPNLTGADFLKWMTEQLRLEPFVRMDLPRFGTAEEQAAYIDQIRSTFLGMCDRDALSRFFSRSDAMAAPRPRFSLPWSVLDEGLPPNDETGIRITSPRPLQIDVHESWVEFLSQGRRWRFDRSVESVLQTLKDGQVHSIGELCGVSDERLDRQAARIFLGELVVKGLAVIVEGEHPHAS